MVNPALKELGFTKDIIFQPSCAHLHKGTNPADTAGILVTATGVASKQKNPQCCLCATSPTHNAPGSSTTPAAVGPDNRAAAVWQGVQAWAARAGFAARPFICRCLEQLCGLLAQQPYIRIHIYMYPSRCRQSDGHIDISQTQGLSRGL